MPCCEKANTCSGEERLHDRELITCWRQPYPLPWPCVSLVRTYSNIIFGFNLFVLVFSDIEMGGSRLPALLFLIILGSLCLSTYGAAHFDKIVCTLLID
jgi:hypothetical protein